MSEELVVVRTEVADGVATVIVRGEIDLATVADLREGLDKAVAARPGRLVVDLGAATFIDCLGIGANRDR
jgi:anti-anti-sigma factor